MGGNGASGGFAVSHERVHALHESLAAAGALLAAVPSTPEADARDASISLSELKGTLFEEVSRLAPFGIGNPKPVFLISPIVVSSIKRFGRESNHAEIVVSCGNTGFSMRTFDFFRAPDDFTHLPVEGKSANILATIVRDTFRGGIALRLVDVLASNTR